MTPCARGCARAAGWSAFQEFMIRLRAAGPVEGVEYRGAEQATSERGGARGDRIARARS